MRQAAINIKSRWQEALRTQWVKLSVLTLGLLLMVFPFWVMIVTSLAAPKTLLTSPAWWPGDWAWENYARLFSEIPMGRYFWNSLFVAVVTTVFHVLFCAMAGYAFSRMSFPRKNLIFFLFLMTLMVPPQVNIVPLFFLMKTFHWIDTYWALIVPAVFGAFGVFLMRQWFNGLPKELEDAAVIDGCSPWDTFSQVALPLARPALAALGIFVFITNWNSFMWPLIVTNSESMRTLPVGIAALDDAMTQAVDWPLLMGASAVSIIPVLIIFLIGQRQFIQGLLAGSLKE